MKGKRFKEEQIIAVLREREAGAKTDNLAPEAWHLRSHALPPVGI